MRAIAEEHVIEKSPSLRSRVHAVCSICGRQRVIEFRSVVKTCRRSGTYRCLKCISNCTNGLEARRRSASTAWLDTRYRERITRSGKNSPRPKFTGEVRAKLREVTKRNWRNPELVAKYLEGSVKGYLASMSGLKTAPHRSVESILRELDIEFESEKQFGRYFADIYISRSNLVIEVNGDYWHNIPKNKARDSNKRRYIEKCGATVWYIWEHELKDTEAVRRRLMTLKENCYVTR